MARPCIEGAAIGAIGMGRRRSRGFTDSQIELLRDLRRAGGDRHQQRRDLSRVAGPHGDLQESLEYQTATSDVLKVISRSAFDLQPVLDTVVEQPRGCAMPIRPLFIAARASRSGGPDSGLPPEYRP